jgi:serine/threonine protein phosphatase PrpC
MSVMLSVICEGLSNVGLVRERNEDAWSVDGATQEGDGVTVSRIVRRYPPPVSVWVADGMGGHGHGEVASADALEWLARTAPDTPDAVVEALQAANERLDDRCRRQPELADMGTTICGLVVTEAGVIVTNVGDSSVFQVDEDLLHELTVRDRNAGSGALTQCLGGGPLVQIAPHVSVLPLRPSTFLLCSDGLTDLVAAEDIEAQLAAGDALVVARLVGSALAAGGADNVTVVLVRIVPAHLVPPPPGGAS